MDGIERMIQKLQVDAQTEIDAVLAAAQSDADAITARYAARAQAECTQLLEKGRREAADQEERLDGLARMEAKKRVLAAKQEMIGRAFDEAAECMVNLPDEEYQDLLRRLALNACTTGREKLVFSVEDRARWGKQVVAAVNEARGAKGETAEVTLAEATRPIRSGLVVQDEDGEIDCSLDTLIRLSRNRLTTLVSELLFGETRGRDSSGKMQGQ